MVQLMQFDLNWLQNKKNNNTKYECIFCNFKAILNFPLKEISLFNSAQGQTIYTIDDNKPYAVNLS